MWITCHELYIMNKTKIIIYNVRENSVAFDRGFRTRDLSEKLSRRDEINEKSPIIDFPYI